MSVVNLIAKSACAGLLPVAIGDVTLAEVDQGSMWSVSPFQGVEKDCVVALKRVGISWPEVGQRNASAAWFGLD